MLTNLLNFFGNAFHNNYQSQIVIQHVILAMVLNQIIVWTVTNKNKIESYQVVNASVKMDIKM